jgi:hypothetical protein
LGRLEKPTGARISKTKTKMKKEEKGRTIKKKKKTIKN